MDKATVLDRVEGDVELLKELVDLFRDDSARLLRELHAALDQGDARALERSAHALKGSVGNFCASSAWEAALNLETLARSGVIVGAEEALHALDREVEALNADLASFAKELA